MLDRNTLYTPSSIAMFAAESGYLKKNSPTLRLEHQRIRIAMGRMPVSHSFPPEGDGTVFLKGQHPTPGWFGWRWQSILGGKYSLRGIHGANF
jgi:hypothetical protein